MTKHGIQHTTESNEVMLSILARVNNLVSIEAVYLVNVLCLMLDWCYWSFTAQTESNG